MKRKVIAGILAAIGGLTITANAGTRPEVPQGIYATTTMVTNLDYDMDIVEVSTMTGIKYQFNDCDDWSIGDFCTVTMWDNGTPDIRDDEVLDVRYSGYIDGWEWVELEAVEHIYE